MLSSTTKEAANDTFSDAKATANSAKRDLRDTAKESGNDLAQYAEKAGREVRHFIDSTSDQFTNAGDRVTSEIRSNPIRSSAIALGVGVLIGALLRR